MKKELSSADLFANQWKTPLLVLFLSIWVVFVHLKLSVYAYDDAYIHFRVVENLLLYNKPYFNPEEIVKTSTSTGWSLLLYLLLSGAKLLFPRMSTPQLVAFVNSFATVGVALIYAKILFRLTSGERSIAHPVFFIATLAITIPVSIGLMETTVSLLLVGIAILLLLKNKSISFLLFGASVFFRPELVILFVIVIVVAIYLRKIPLRYILLYSILGAVPFVLYDLIFFRTLVPNSVLAKQFLYSLGFKSSIQLLLMRLSASFSLFPFVLDDKVAQVYMFAYLLSFLTLMLLFVRNAIPVFVHKQGASDDKEKTVYRLMFFSWGMSTLFFYIAGKSHIFPWYDPIIFIPLFLSVVAVLEDIQPQWKGYASIILVLPFFLTHLISLLLLSYAALGNPAYFIGFPEGARVRQYIHLGQELYTEYPTVKLMSSEIGGLGYGFRGSILDAGGLASPEAILYQKNKRAGEQRSIADGIIPIAYIDDKNPEIIVSYDIYLSSLSAPSLDKNYVKFTYPIFLDNDLTNRIVKPLGGPPSTRELWGIDNLYVFIRRDLFPQ